MTPRDYMITVMLVGMGGFAGANARFFLTAWANRVAPTTVILPVGTGFVNLTGSFLLAVFLTWAARQTTMPVRTAQILGTGFFGSYTTFSTFANESVALARGETWSSALFYLIGTNMVCVLGVLAGIYIGNRL